MTESLRHAEQEYAIVVEIDEWGPPDIDLAWESYRSLEECWREEDRGVGDGA